MKERVLDGAAENARTTHWGMIASLVAYVLTCVGGMLGTFFYVYDFNRWAIVQTIAVLFAGGVYLWYSWETLFLRRAAERQLEFAQGQAREAIALRHVAENQVRIAQSQLTAMMRPIVIAGPSGMGLSVGNVGVGPALNVGVQPLFNTVDSEYRVSPFVTALAKGEWADLEAEYYIAGKEMGRAPTVFDPKHIITTHSILIEYFTVDNVRCTTEIEMSSSGYRVTRVEVGGSPVSGML